MRVVFGSALTFGIVAALAVLFGAAPACMAAADWSENFDSYSAGDKINEQDDWTTWDEDVTVWSIVSDTQAASGDNSVLIAINGDGLNCDIVHTFSEVTSGTWEFKAKVYIPSSQTGNFYFIVLDNYNVGAANPKHWAVQVRFNAVEGVVADAQNGSPSLTLRTDEWVEIVLTVDLAANISSFTYGGQILYQDIKWAPLVAGDNSMVAISALDLYAEGCSEAYVDDVSLKKVCVPATITRNVTTNSTLVLEGVPAPAYTAGSVLSATFAISNIRAAGGDCQALADVTLVEALPAGWTPTDITGGGAFADGKITWSIPAAQLATAELSYKASGPVTDSIVPINGTFTEQGNPVTFLVKGTRVATDVILGPDGIVHGWLLLGPYQHNTISQIPDSQRLDFLSDGVSITEEDVMPKVGDAVQTKYGAGAAVSLRTAANTLINPCRVPQWYESHDANGQVDFVVSTLYGANDQSMAYAVAYLCLEEDTSVSLAAGSDDTLQILIDTQEVWIYSTDRAWTGYVDMVPAVALTKGVHRLMAKVFNAGGGWNFGVKVLDENGQPFTSGVTMTLDPRGCAAPPRPAAPTGLTTVAGSLKVALDWDDSAPGTFASYRVYRSTLTACGPFTMVAENLTTSAYADTTGLANNRTYHYAITTVDASGSESFFSTSAKATTRPPARPTGLTATAGDGKIDLDWADNAATANEIGYNVYRSLTAGGPYGDPIASSVATSAYTDTAVTGGTTYYYAVTAVALDVGGTASVLSSEVFATVPSSGISVLMGDANGSTKVDIADAIALLGYLFAQKTPPVCAKAADANDDDQLNIADAITILGYLFSQKPMFAPDHSDVLAANNNCTSYPSSDFPAKIGALDTCATPCQ